MALSNWKYYRDFTISISKITEGVTNLVFPLYLTSTAGISDKDLTSIFTDLQGNYKRIAVTFHSNNENTQCYCEVHPNEWDYQNNRGVIWVNPGAEISATGDAVFRLYYDGTHADNTSYIFDSGTTSAQTNVWDTKTWGAFLMADTPAGSGSIIDSAGYDHPGTPVGGMGASNLVDCDIGGKALDFPGYQSGQYIDCGINWSTLTDGFQADILAKFEDIASTNIGGIFSLSKLDGNISQFGINAGNNNLEFEVNSNKTFYAPFTDALSWHAVSYQYDDSTDYASWIIDGVKKVDLWGAIFSFTDFKTLIGAYYDSDRTFGGKIAHVRFGHQRTDAWRMILNDALLDNLGTWGDEQSGIVLRYAYSGKTTLFGGTPVGRKVLLIKRTPDSEEILSRTNSDPATGNFEFRYRPEANADGNELVALGIDDDAGDDYNDVAVRLGPGILEV